MFRYLNLTFGVLLALPAAADQCDDLWFTRNQIMDRAGYCFGSTLGQAVFDNAGCLGKSVNLSPDQSALVTTIRQQEKLMECRVNTRGTYLELEDLGTRLRLWDLPVADEFESACIGFRAAPIDLRAGVAADAPVLHRVGQGSNLRYSHLPRAGWTYVVVTNAQWQFTGAGWMPIDTVKQPDCESWAG